MNKDLNDIIEETFKNEVRLTKEWERLEAKIHHWKCKNTIISKKKKYRMIYYVFKYVAAVFLGVLITSGVLLFSTNEKGATVHNYKLVTGKGEKSFLELSDGTKVWINPCTTLEYSSAFGLENRAISLDGEVFMEVAKNKKLPLVVKTKDVVITALGTSFNISAYREDSQLVATLLTGKISFQAIETKQEIILEPEQLAIYHKDTGKLEAMPCTPEQHNEWKEGSLTFNMLYLRDIAKLLERKYNVVFVFQNKKVESYQFRGSFKNNESLSDILNVIKINTHINYQRQNDTIYVR